MENNHRPDETRVNRILKASEVVEAVPRLQGWVSPAGPDGTAARGRPWSLGRPLVLDFVFAYKNSP